MRLALRRLTPEGQRFRRAERRQDLHRPNPYVDDPVGEHRATLLLGATAEGILSAIEAFSKPATIEAAIARLKVEARLGSESAREVIGRVVAGRFIQPA